MKKFSVCFSAIIIGTCLLFSGCDESKTKKSDAKPGDLIEDAKGLTESWKKFGENTLKRGEELENKSSNSKAVEERAKKK